jgi:hypothetical protein
MKHDSPHQPVADGPGPDQEKWISGEEVLKLFNITDRQLKYWRDTGKIVFKTIRKRSFYVESSVRAQVEKTEKPKKYWRFKSLKDLRTIDPPLVLLIVAACLLLANGFQNTEVLLAWLIYNWAPVLLITTALLWYLTRLIIYIYKRFFEKEEKDN